MKHLAISLNTPPQTSVALFKERERERKKENACGLIELVLNETANVEQVNYVLLRVAPHIEF